jgi:hypothetical protein
MQTEKGLGLKFTFSGSVYFERMKQRGAYTTDVAEIRRRVEAAGLTDVFNTPAADAVPALPYGMTPAFAAQLQAVAA